MEQIGDAEESTGWKKLTISISILGGKYEKPDDSIIFFPSLFLQIQTRNFNLKRYIIESGKTEAILLLSNGDSEEKRIPL